MSRFFRVKFVRIRRKVHLQLYATCRAGPGIDLLLLSYLILLSREMDVDGIPWTYPHPHKS